MVRKNVPRLGRGLSSLISDYREVAEIVRDDRASGDVSRETSSGALDAAPDAVVPSAIPESPAKESAISVALGIEARMVGVEELKPNPLQPRRVFDEEKVRGLADSIATSGMIQPIVVRNGADGLEIVAGERRWRAAKMAGLTEVPVLVREASDEAMLELALVENIHREDLNAVDRAMAYRMYCDEFGLSADEVGKRVGEDRTTVTNYLRLLELPEKVLRMLATERISMGHARALIGVTDEDWAFRLAQRAALQGLSVRAVEEAARQGKRRSRRAKPAVRAVRAQTGLGLPAHIKDLERRFEERLGTKVRIELGKSRQDGQVVIEFYGVGEFEGICKKIGVIKGEGES